jgi:type VI secretion system protein ImpE
MNAEELFRAGQLEEALAALQEEIRQKPEDSRLRLFLFQINCVLGRWEKALTQLQVIAGLNIEGKLLAQLFHQIIECELLRAEVFQGQKRPLIFGEPAEWMGWLVQANELVAGGRFKAARELRDRAFEAAPATAGQLDGHAFEWLADADPRLGPMLEVIMEGRYFWVPFHRIKRLVLEKPSDLRDLVWLPAQFVWANGGQAAGHVPVRYPQTEQCPESALRLARRTEWSEKEGGWLLGLGQRMLATNEAEFPLLECRALELRPET